MNRPAVRLSVCFTAWFAAVSLGWSPISPAEAAPKKKAPAPAAAPEKAPEEAAPPADPAAEETPVTPESLDPSADGQPAPVGAEVVDAKAGKAATTLSWQDIVVVPRKRFLKGGRVELAPFTGLSVNDNLIRHYSFGLDFNYFLTDVFVVGLQGQYFVKAFTEREELIGAQYNRIPTLNRYLYAAALNFGYVPVYGKFTLFNRSIMHWEIYASAGVGITRTEIIPRRPGAQTFTTDALTPNAGLGSRFFLFDWLTVNFAVRDYIFADKFENQDRMPGEDGPTAKANATSALVNNVMVYVGAGIYLPMGFEYKSPR